MNSLHEFEKYIKSTHLSEIDVISDLLSELIKKETPTTAIQSIPLIQDSLIILGTIRKRKLGAKFTEQHLEIIIKHSLTIADQTEYRERYAREKYEGKLFSSTFMGTSGASGAAGGSDSDSDASIDWDKTMHEEIIESSLDNRRRFLTRFLHIKLVQLKDTVERACFLQCGLVNRETKVYSDSESETTEIDSSPDNFRGSISDQSTDTDDLESDNGARETVSAPDTSEPSHFDQSTDTDDLIMYDNNGYIYTSTTSLSSELSNGSPASLDLHSSDNNKTVKPVVPVMSDVSTTSSNDTHVPNEGYQSLEVRLRKTLLINMR